MNIERPKNDNRDPSQITDVFARLGRHFYTMERYILAGKKHSWLAMSKDALEGIGVLNTNVRELLRKSEKVVTADQLAAVMVRIDALDKRLGALMRRQEEIDGR